jgi:hypothetical protein
MKRTKYTEAWLAALRSGEYKQGAGMLCGGGRYCCFGVAGLVFGLGDLNERFENYEEIRESMGISILEQETLTSANDSGEKTFPEIADLIETMLEPVACR